MSKAKYTVFYVSLGCFKNLYDTEDVSGFFFEEGFLPAPDPSSADVIFVNTCAFLKESRDEAEEVIREMIDEGGGIPIIVGGCLVRKQGEVLRLRYPEVKAVVASDEYCNIGKIARGVIRGKEKTALGTGYEIPWWHPQRFRMTPGSYAYLKIAEGCGRNCTFCTIPGIRGPLCSQPIEKLAERALTLSLHGVKELILISQDCSLYGTDIYGRPGLPDLLRELVRIGTLEWIRVLYLYPGPELNEELIEIVSREDKICSYYDIPFQHASGAVLKRMGRRGNAEEYLSLINRIRKADPDAALRTTFITGFPGETDEDVDLLIDFMKQARFMHLGCFVYSDEEDAPSFRLDGKVSGGAGEERRQRVMTAQQQISSELLDSFIGRKLKIAVEGINSEGDSIAHGACQAPVVDGAVIIPGELEPGSFALAEITGVSGYDLCGIITDSDN